MNKASRPKGRPKSRLRGVCFRLAAVLLGLAPLVALEGALRLLDWGRPELHDDPFVGFSATRPLFVKDSSGEKYVIPKARQAFFRPQEFDVEKPPDGFRAFCLGGSTVQGRPFAVETSFTTWLELALQTAHPQRRWRVVNCGGVSYASYRLVPILEEILASYAPDLIIVYTGHNEFLEDRTYANIKDAPEALRQAQQAAGQLRTFTLLREGYLRLRGQSSNDPPPGRPILPEEVEALLDYRGGLEEYHRDEKWRRDVIDHYAYNLRRMQRLTREAGVPLLLVNPVCNLRDTPPFKSQHREGLSAEELKRWEACWQQARPKYRLDMHGAIELLEQAAAIDDRDADIHYQLGKCYDSLDMHAKAKAAYLRAKEEDICPLRILEPMNQAVLDLARDTGTPVVDAAQLFADRSEGGIVGADWLLDHVHPSIAGHQLLAVRLAEELARMGVVKLPPGWKVKADARFQEHLDSLDEVYFHRGHARLEVLRDWAAGRMDRVRGEK